MAGAGQGSRIGRGWALGLALALGLAPAGLRAQEAPLAGLPPAAAARLSDAAALGAGLARHPQGRVAVIVDLAVPASAAAGEGDLRPAVGAVQARVLARVLGPVLPADGTAAAAGLNLRRMAHSPVIALQADAALIARLAQDPEVLAIRPDFALTPALTQSLPHIGVPAAIAAGASGSGWTVAVLDTGARRSHEFLAARVVAAACYNSIDPAGGVSSLCPGGAASGTGLDAANDCDPASFRGCGHGTHVAGIAAGYFGDRRSGSPAHGVARNAGLISIAVFSQANAQRCRDQGFAPLDGQQGCVIAFASDILLGLERVYDLRHQHRIAAVNLSLGGQAFSAEAACNAYWPALTTMVGWLRDAGIATVVAAGNTAQDNATLWPACLSAAVAVANATYEDTRESSSNWGDLVDLAAPGRRITSAVVRGGSNGDYGQMTGTSMAAPHVAGALAVLRAARPEAGVAELVQALAATGTPVAWAGVTRPRINLDRALDRLWQDSTPTVTRLSGPAAAIAGQPVAFAIRVEAEAGTPAGRAALRLGGTELAAAELAGGEASLSVALPAGSHRLSAAYTGGGRHRASVSAELAVEVRARPANDDFAARAAIPAPGRVTGDTGAATREEGEPGAALPSLWWAFTPAAAGRVTLDAAGSAAPPVIEVYTGASLAALAPVALDPEGAGFAFQAQAGVAYAIALKTPEGQGGPVALDLALAAQALATTVTLTGPATGTAGQPVEFVARVAAADAIPPGRVELRNGAAPLASAALDASGAARLAAVLPAGTHSLTAHYPGSPGFAPAVSAPLVLTLDPPPPAPAEFAGGGSVFGLTEGCTGGWNRTGESVRVRYWPSELGASPASEVTITWPSGGEHLLLWGGMQPGSEFRGGSGRQIWSYFVFYPRNPLIRVAQRLVTLPPGGTLDQAQELVLRLRVQNFAAQPGCTAVLAAVLRRR